MRLLNLNSLDLVEFMDLEKPPYVILSHTWGAGEISLQELQSQHPDVKRKNGWTKIMNFARKGNENGFEWGWVDTCCIDKTSSAELSEAINSMFKWYQGADSCYAYLSDVSSPGVVQPEPIPRTTAEQFASSRWFTRGWTLQELLAPASVVFYLQDWTMYGTKSSFRDEISRITGIPAVTTTQPNSLRTFSVAQRISWVSNRQTTRPEDLSYCLLGILGVHMPLLYGEGTRAFIRLQEEVIKVGNDPTIFAWLSSATTTKCTLTTAPADDWASPLAPSPKHFMNAGKTKRSFSRDKQYGPWFVTSFGIRIERLPMLKSTKSEPLLTAARFQLQNDREYAIALLGCYRADEDDESACKQYGLALCRNNDIYYRSHRPESLLLLDSSVSMSKRVNCTLHSSQEVRWKPPERSPWVIRQLPEEIHGFSISGILGWSWDYEKEIYRHLYVNDHLAYETKTPVEAIIFSNDVKKEEFFVFVRYVAIGPWSWISIIANTSRDDLSRQRGWLNSYERQTEHEDQASAPLGDGKEVMATVVRGVKDGKRVFYLDVCIRDIS